ncbi:MAG: RsmD family RNA methyltransferase [Acidobacteriota bacterium]
MRITGGAWASRRLAATPKGRGVRPTPDALREQAFAVLGPHLDGADFLDVFAGTGVNSLEALSRGAARAALVEWARGSAELIRRNLSALVVSRDRAELLVLPWERAIPALASMGWQCSVAWCDPPFDGWEEGPLALARARERGVLVPDARVVLEAPPRREVSVPGFEVVRELRGAVLLRAT